MRFMQVRESTLDTAVQGYRFAASDPNSDTNSTKTTVYNNLGEAREVQTFFTKAGYSSAFDRYMESLLSCQPFPQSMHITPQA